MHLDFILVLRSDGGSQLLFFQMAGQGYQGRGAETPSWVRNPSTARSDLAPRSAPPCASSPRRALHPTPYAPPPRPALPAPTLPSSQSPNPNPTGPRRASRPRRSPPASPAEPYLQRVPSPRPAPALRGPHHSTPLHPCAPQPRPRLRSPRLHLRARPAPPRPSRARPPHPRSPGPLAVFYIKGVASGAICMETRQRAQTLGGGAGGAPSRPRCAGRGPLARSAGCHVPRQPASGTFLPASAHLFLAAARAEPGCYRGGGERGPAPPAARPAPAPPAPALRASPGSPSTWPSRAWAAAAAPSSRAWRSLRASGSWTLTGARSRRSLLPGAALGRLLAAPSWLEGACTRGAGRVLRPQGTEGRLCAYGPASTARGRCCVVGALMSVLRLRRGPATFTSRVSFQRRTLRSKPTHLAVKGPAVSDSS